MVVNESLRCTAFGCSAPFNDATGKVFSDTERACGICLGRFAAWQVNSHINCKNCGCHFELHSNTSCICDKCNGFVSPVFAAPPSKKLSKKQRKKQMRLEKKRQKELERLRELEALEAQKIKAKPMIESELVSTIQSFATKNAGRYVKISSDDKIVDQCRGRIIGWRDDMIVVECENEYDNEVLDVDTISLVVEDFNLRITDKFGDNLTHILGKLLFIEEISIIEWSSNTGESLEENV